MTSSLFTRLALSLAIFILFFAVVPVAPRLFAAESKAEPADITLKFRDESLDQVLRLLERFTGRSVIRPQGLPLSTFTFESQSQMTKTEAVIALKTMLAINQIGVSELGEKFLKVVSLASTKSEAPEFIEDSALLRNPSGQIAVKLFTFDFLRASEVMPQVLLLLNPTIAGTTLFEKANAIMVTDSISNLQRIEMLVSKIDRPFSGSAMPKNYSLRFAKASDLVTKLKGFLSTPALQAQYSSASINGDDRTNQIFLICDLRQQGFFDDLIKKLDGKADPNTRNEVIYLKHATSKDVATLLTSLVSGQNNATSKASGAAGAGPRPTTQPALPVPGAPAPTSPVPIVPTDITSALGDTSYTFSTLLTILSDERSNSIIVSGTVDDIRLINELVEKVDVLLAQVRIESLFVEVSLSDDDKTGIQSLHLDVQGNKLVGFSGALAGATITNGTRAAAASFPELSYALDFAPARTNNHATIQGSPSVTTTHNKEAHIFVGETRPVITAFQNTGVATSTGTGAFASGLSSSVTQQKIGTEIKIKPLIGNDGSVQLEITEKVEEVNGSISINGTDQPIISSRELSSFTTVNNHEIVVLGGLQRKKVLRNEQRLGIIGQIPVIGWIFGSHEKSVERTDLIVFLRPTILTNKPIDNQPAIQQIYTLPNRDDILKSIGEPIPAPLKKSNEGFFHLTH